MSGDLRLARRPPLAMVRYCLEKLERAAIKRGEYPVLVHAAYENLDQLAGLLRKIQRLGTGSDPTGRCAAEIHELVSAALAKKESS